MRSSRATRQGEVLNGVYQLDELLSIQDTHENYAATERPQGRRVYVRLLRAEYALQGAVVEDFLRAPRTLQRLVHSSLPCVRVERDETGIPFVVEEVVETRPLDELWLGFPQGMPLGLATHVLLPLVEALALAHEQDIVHGAIDSTCVRWAGRPTAPVPRWLELGETSADRRKCDAPYRAPELAQDASATKRADVFAAGVLVYRMLSGQVPARTRDGGAQALDEVAPQLPAAWSKLIGACLEVDPRRRYRDATALLESMRRCARDSSSWPSPDQPFARSSAPNAGVYREHRAPAASRARSRPAQPTGAADGFDVQEGNSDNCAGRPRASRPDVPPSATVAAAFAPLEDAPLHRAGAESRPAPAGIQERSRRAQEIASRLSSKLPPLDRESARGRASSRPVRGQRTLAVPPPRPISRAPSERARARRQTPGQTAAALAELQLQALRALRPQAEDDDDRWVALFLLLFLALLLQLALPLLYEPQMARARALFGTNLPLVSAGFTVTVVIATVRVWVGRIQSGPWLARSTGFAMLLTAVCVCALCATLLTGSAGAARFAGLARSTLPWAMSLLFFLFAFGGLLCGLRAVSNEAFYGLMVILLAIGCLYGSYRAVFSTVLARKHDRGAPVAREHEPVPAPRDTRDSGKVTPSGASPTAATEAQDEPQAIDAMEQRGEVGADEAQDLKSSQDLGAARARSRTVLRKALETAPH